MPDFRRGAAAIQESLERAKSERADFKPFTPKLYWEDNDESRYLLFLNPLDDIPKVDMIGFIPIKGKKRDGEQFVYYEQVIARTDPGLGEDDDPMVDEWGANPRETNIAVAVELDPTYTTYKGRKRPSGFEIKTTTFERRVRDDKGELTDETEEVVAPVVGFVTQSPHNFFNVVTSFDANEAPIEETPVKITRVGGKGENSTAYRIDGYPEQDIDFANLIEYIDGLSYLTDDEIDELLEGIDGLGDQEAVLAIGTFLLDKRLDELADRDRYDKLLEGIDSPFRFGTKAKKDVKKERPTRRSQRRRQVESEPESEPEPEETPEAEEKPKRTRRTRKAAEPEPEAEEPKEEKPKRRGRARAKEAEPEKGATGTRKIEELRKRAAARAAKREKEAA